MTAHIGQADQQIYRITLRGQIDEEFVEAYCPPETVLAPVTLFTVHMLNTGAADASRAARAAYLKAVRPLLPGAEEVTFEGLMDYSRLSFPERSRAGRLTTAVVDALWLCRFVAVLVIHGLIHLLGFTKAFGLAQPPQLHAGLTLNMYRWYTRPNDSSRRSLSRF